MTEQKAIETIKYASAFNSDNSQLTEALDIAIKALHETQKRRAEQIIEVIDNLVGGITPIGESNYDEKAKENLNIMIEIIDHYIEEVCEIANMDNYQSSIQECKKIAEKFVRSFEDLETPTQY